MKMKNMLVDTSGRGLSVTVCDENKTPFASLFLTLENSLSEKMLWAMDNFMAAASLRPEDIDNFYVVTGPGSFTGIRIGVATLLGFCMAQSKVLRGISSLDAAAIISGKDSVTTGVRLRGTLHGYRSYDFGTGVFSDYMTEKLDSTDGMLIVNGKDSSVDLSRAILSDRFEQFITDYAPMYMRPSEAEITFDKKSEAC